MDVYGIDGKTLRSIEMPGVFSGEYREDLVRRALLSEQSAARQPQGHFTRAGFQTTAVYVGKYSAAYRRGRHMGIAIRPRQKLGGGAQGDVRRIPSAVKGHRAHPHKIEKTIEEQINRKEYAAAIRAAIAGSADPALVGARHSFVQKQLPIVVADGIESVSKSKELIKALASIGLANDLERSHSPRLRRGLKRLSRVRHFRTSVLIVSRQAGAISRAGRNIPGVDVCTIDDLTVGKLAPGAKPRLAVWTEGAIGAIEARLAKGYNRR